MSKIYLEEFDSWANVVEEFTGTDATGQRTWRPPTNPSLLKEPEHVYAVYDQGGYEGDAFVAFERDGKFYTNEGSHCSCFGLEETGWEPEEYDTKELFLAQLDRRGWGLMHNHRDELHRWATGL